MAERIIPLIIAPTCTGKTGIISHLANPTQKAGAAKSDIVLLDCVQTYKGFDIIAGSPDEKEKKLAKYHFLDEWDPVKDAWKSKKTEKAKEEFITALQKKIKELTDSGKSFIFEGGCKRFIKPLLENINTILPPDYKLKIIGLRRSTEDLYKRCEERATRMLEQGGIDEARRLIEQGLGDVYPFTDSGYRIVRKFIDKKLNFNEMKKELSDFFKKCVDVKNKFMSEIPIQWLEIKENEKDADIAKRLNQAIL